MGILIRESPFNYCKIGQLPRHKIEIAFKIIEQPIVFYENGVLCLKNCILDRILEYQGLNVYEKNIVFHCFLGFLVPPPPATFFHRHPTR